MISALHVSQAESTKIRKSIESAQRSRERITRLKRVWMNLQKWASKRRWKLATLALVVSNVLSVFACAAWNYFAKPNQDQTISFQFASMPVAAPGVDAGLQLKLSLMISSQSFQLGDSK